MAAVTLLAAIVAGSAYSQTFQDGTHIIGVDIAPGVYRSPGGEWCQWFRLPDLSGDITKAHAYGFMAKKPTVEIEATDKAFRAQNCGTWTLIETGSSAAPAAVTTADRDNAASVVALMVHAIALHEVIATHDRFNEGRLGSWFLEQLRARLNEQDLSELAPGGHKMLATLTDDLSKRLAVKE